MNAPHSPVQPATPLPGPGTPATRLVVALRALRWSYGTLAVALGRSPSTVRNWGLGRMEAPPDVLSRLERLAAFHREWGW